jgi:hypothetical protein
MLTRNLAFAIVVSLTCANYAIRAQEPPKPEDIQQVERIRACSKYMPSDPNAYKLCVINAASPQSSEPIKPETQVPKPGSLTDEQVNQAINRGKGKAHMIGLSLVDQQEVFATLMCKDCAQSGYSIYVYNPEQWIELQAARAKKLMMPFTLADVTDEMRQPLLHVTALPSTSDYLTGSAMSLSSSVQRIVLSDASRQTTIQPLELENGTVETNSAFRSAQYTTATASFNMSDVDCLRATDNKGEFFIVVVGTNKNKFFKVKSRFLPELFTDHDKH